MSARLVALRFDVYCTRCQVYLGLCVGKMEARRAANRHRREDRVKGATTPLVIHDAKLPGVA